VSLTRIGAWCSIALVVAFVAGIALMAASGVQVLIPETGKDGLDWIADVDDASGASMRFRSAPRPKKRDGSGRMNPLVGAGGRLDARTDDQRITRFGSAQQRTPTCEPA